MSRNKHIFQLSPQEQQDRLLNRVAEVQQENLNAGLYNIFQDTQSKDQLVLKYREHTDVIKVDATNGRSRLVKRSIR